VSEPQAYETVDGRRISKEDIDIVGRIMSMGTLHKAYAGTGAICTAGAARIKGTVVNEVFAGDPEKEHIRIGHPGGIMPVSARVSQKGGTVEYEEGIIYRTARRLMEGYVCVPEKYLRKGMSK